MCARSPRTLPSRGLLLRGPRTLRPSAQVCEDGEWKGAECLADCPADPDPNAKFNWTYGVNIEVTGEDLANPAWNPLKRIEDSGAPSQKIFMMDTKALYFDWTYGIKEYYTKANGGFLGTLERIDRHTNGVNGLFLDGHVAFFSYSTAPDNCDMILADDQVSSFNCEIP